MEGYSRATRRVRDKVGEDVRTAGPSGIGHAAPGRGRALERLRSGWRRRAGATGALLAVIAVTLVITG
ncbi:hypothetical protein [Pseudoduganella albidiflava]|uniref:Uncharacterized protein n=1 Tax=Pseudoduganella albidiflava TaxID=321983 RepID=A0AA88C229_9BURK|nr:hypothetical protein [Pseudoduganella albidiflava]GGY33910.1 hypothetical protein GCM10007387_14780 [Pseudoduganella albidiflava]